MNMDIGQQFPNFSALAYVHNVGRRAFNFYDHCLQHRGRWVVFLTASQAANPVVTSELAALVKSKNDFAERKTTVVVLCHDTVENVEQVAKDIDQAFGLSIHFPIIVDTDGTVGRMLRCVDLHGADVPTTYVLDQKKRVFLTSEYPAVVGRNWKEICRSIDALKLTKKFKVSTPVNWANKEHVFIRATLSEKQIRKNKLHRGVQAIAPYFQRIPMPVEKQ